MYNLGLACKKLNKYDLALDSFLKLQQIMRNDAQVMFQVADVYRLIEDGGAAVDWLQQALSGTVIKLALTDAGEN